MAFQLLCKILYQCLFRNNHFTLITFDWDYPLIEADTVVYNVTQKMNEPNLSGFCWSDMTGETGKEKY